MLAGPCTLAETFHYKQVTNLSETAVQWHLPGTGTNPQPSQGLLQRNGGAAAVESRASGGTEVRLRLPRGDGTADGKGARP